MLVRCENWKKCKHPSCSHKKEHYAGLCTSDICKYLDGICKPIRKKPKRKMQTAWIFMVWHDGDKEYSYPVVRLRHDEALNERECCLEQGHTCGPLTKIKLPMPGGKK